MPGPHHPARSQLFLASFGWQKGHEETWAEPHTQTKCWVPDWAARTPIHLAVAWALATKANVAPARNHEIRFTYSTQSESKWNIAPLNLESKTSSLGTPDHAPVNQKGKWWIAAQVGWLRGGPFNELMSMAHIPHLQHSLPHIQMRWLQNRSAKLWACGATPGGGTKSSKATCQMRLQSEQLPSHRKLQTSLPPPRQPHKMVKWGDTQIFGTFLLGAVRCCYN